MIFSIFARRSSPIIGLTDTCLTGELTFGSDADASSPVTFCFCPWERCCPHELEATFSAAAMASLGLAISGAVSFEAAGGLGRMELPLGLNVSLGSLEVVSAARSAIVRREVPSPDRHPVGDAVAAPLG